MEMRARHTYGPFVPGREYRSIGRGYDHYLVKLRGSLWCVPTWVFEE